LARTQLVLNSEIFREYDVRGVVDKDLNADIIYDLGKAIGTYAIPRGVKTRTLGMDCQRSSKAYCDAIRGGINDHHQRWRLVFSP
jgi:phosphomannomutase / phosphoglucomutase